MIITYIMNNKLEKKLLYIKAKEYVSQLKGIESFTISYVNDEDFVWYKKQLKLFFKIDQIDSLITLEHPISKKELIEIINKILKNKTFSKCIQLFEEKIAIHLNINNLDDFLNSIFRYNQTFDLSLLFLEPERILVINDDEYEVHLHYCINN
ncbi:hypothetical protein BGI33_02900 [Snodgrassella alvi]|uniref:Uncharacterized protein n=2 Tax=Snodgrassella alvi TaxID=1196083 RepID=A0A2N9WTH4_9NEIS|nr:hypothetical protein BGI33_12405 [Snodgrassella alvi]PIT14845.1 hypothetical protein BGI32_06815 [Snodgrassella alvi]PIT15036.1 hypothetical protein BGI34_11855 [Snodgrassella alvi]PIT16821.1 hypothetical protein BGI34_09205 [Snodgrassella alvi]PIT17456.1 hypothetical protein BGI33_02900 [Snodgrassella alvi]